MGVQAQCGEKHKGPLYMGWAWGLYLAGGVDDAVVGGGVVVVWEEKIINSEMVR